MKESEQALSDAAAGSKQRECEIARQILSDPRIYSLWESRHADLMVPAARHSQRAPQIVTLRDIEVRLVHRRALTRHIREKRILGEQRARLFATFYGPVDTTNAILAEHRQYRLAVSSRVSTDHLIGIMSDPASVKLIRQYQSIYSAYFELYCYVACCEDADVAGMIKPAMLRWRSRTLKMIQRIRSERPDSRH